MTVAVTVKDAWSVADIQAALSYARTRDEQDLLGSLLASLDLMSKSTISRYALTDGELKALEELGEAGT